jgi:hypothetical protein
MKAAFVVSDAHSRISIVNFDIDCGHETFDPEAAWRLAIEREPKLESFTMVGVLDRTPMVGFHWWETPEVLRERMPSFSGPMSLRIPKRKVSRLAAATT